LAETDRLANSGCSPINLCSSLFSQYKNLFRRPPRTFKLYTTLYA